MFLFLSVLFLAPYTESCVRVTTDAPASSTPSAPSGSCTSCNIAAIAPVLTDPATSFESRIRIYAESGCMKTQITCKRTDDQICVSVGFRVTGSSGTFDIGTQSGVNSASTFLDCARDSTIYTGGLERITKVECVFQQCAPPVVTVEPGCRECNLNTITPENLATGEQYQAAVIWDDECVKIRGTCSRKDGQVCERVAIWAQKSSAPLPVAISDSNSPTFATSTVTCARDGSYSYGPVTGIIKLACEYVNCKLPPSCTSCDVNSIAPVMTEEGTRFRAEDMMDGETGCKSTIVICERTDGKSCALMRIRAKTPLGMVQLAWFPGSRSLGTTVYCAADGTYGAEGLNGITELECVYENCG